MNDTVNDSKTSLVWIGTDTSKFQTIVIEDINLPKVGQEFDFFDEEDKSVHKGKVLSIKTDTHINYLEVYDYNEKGVRFFEIEKERPAYTFPSEKEKIFRPAGMFTLFYIFKSYVLIVLPFVFLCMIIHLLNQFFVNSSLEEVITLILSYLLGSCFLYGIFLFFLKLKYITFKENSFEIGFLFKKEVEYKQIVKIDYSILPMDLYIIKVRKSNKITKWYTNTSVSLSEIKRFISSGE